ncbi:MAG: hypothetical protein Q9160_005618 [Pyrenula sp. 1 TL-2023]
MAAQNRSELKVLELQWKPDIDFVPADELMKPTRDSTAEQQMLERMYVMCAVEIREQLQAAKCTKPHFERYRSWLAAEYDRFKKPGLPLVPDSADIVAMSSKTRREAIAECHEKGKGTRMWPVLEAAWRVYVNTIDVVEGRLKLVRVLMEDRLFPQFYDWANELTNLRPLFNIIGHSNPHLRVLEIGAGTGGTTARALDGLKSDYGERLYSKYVFTDISELFLEPAKRRFEAFQGVEYRKLDVSRDPREQGFEEGAYDLVIASNKVWPGLARHAMSCGNAEELPHIVAAKWLPLYARIIPTNIAGKYIQYIVGLLPGWWLGDDDGRPDGPCVSPNEWDRRLRQAGFEGLHAVGFDNKPPYYYNANMLSRPIKNVEKSPRITLLTQSESLSTFAQHVANALTEIGYRVEQQSWGHQLHKDQNVVSLIDLERSTPLLQDISSENSAYFMRTMQDMTGMAVLWVMPSAQISCSNPHYGQMLGVARSMRAELAVGFAILELEKTENKTKTASIVAEVLRKFQRARNVTDNLIPDTEYIFAAGHVLTGRFHQLRIITPLSGMSPTSNSKSVSIAQNGIDRIAVRMPEVNFLPLTPSPPALLFKADVSYLFVGGLGALERTVISWMVAAGARDLIVLSQSANNSAEDQAFIERMTECNCFLRCFWGDATDRDVVQRVLVETHKPIAGVMQMAMASQHIDSRSLDRDSWTTAARPQIYGTWNLHHLLPKMMDFFVLVSFNSGNMASLERSSNAAATSFLDAFLQYRHGLGLPTSMINVCDNGDPEIMMQRSSKTPSAIDSSWGTLLFEQEFLYDLRLAVVRPARQYIAHPVVTNPIQGYRNPSRFVLINDLERSLTHPRDCVVWKADPRVAICPNVEGDADTTDRRDEDQSMPMAEKHEQLLVA